MTPSLSRSVDNVSTLTPEDLVKQFHDASMRIVLALHGHENPVIGQLSHVRKESAAVLELRESNTLEPLAQWLGHRLPGPTGPRTARALAMGSFCRAMNQYRNATSIESLAGVAVTTTKNVVSERQGMTARWIHVSVQNIARTISASLLLLGSRSSREENSIVDRLVLNYVALACGCQDRLAVPLSETDRFFQTWSDGQPEWRDLVRSARQATCVLGPAPSANAPMPRAVFPGAFNRLHDGHRKMSQIAKELLRCEVAWEVSIENVDKPMLDYTEIAQRVAQFPRSQMLWLTRAATFVEKSALFPGVTFVVGADTLARIADPLYYGGSARACQAAVEQIAARQCRFLVFGRDGEHGYQTVSNLRLTGTLRALCQEVGPERFRNDVSSTKLRQTMH